MKTTTLAIAALVFIGAALVTFAIVRWLEIDAAELAFVVGGVLASQIAAVIHYRTPGSKNTVGVKVTLGVVLAIAALAFGLILNALFSPFKFAEISIPIATLGVFAFPFAVFGTTWNALSKSKRP
jgi:hypothetical protein